MAQAWPNADEGGQGVKKDAIEAAGNLRFSSSVRILVQLLEYQIQDDPFLHLL
jgi:hypothetical protein